MIARRQPSPPSDSEEYDSSYTYEEEEEEPKHSITTVEQPPPGVHIVFVSFGWSNIAKTKHSRFFQGYGERVPNENRVEKDFEALRASEPCDMSV